MRIYTRTWREKELQQKLASKRQRECIYTGQSCKHRHCLNNSLLLRTILSVLLHYRSLENILIFPYFKYLFKKKIKLGRLNVLASK